MSVLMTGVRLTKRGLLITLIFYFVFFTLYNILSVYVLQRVVGSSAETYPLAYASFNFIIAITLLLASFFIHRFNKMRIIYESSIVTAILIILLLFVSSTILKLIIIFGV